MNERNADALYGLCAGLKLTLKGGEVVGVWGRFMRPMDIGGTDGSHHSQTLRRLAARGWVESSARHGLAGLRRHRLYRITLAGVRALANHQAQLGRPVSSLAATVEVEPDDPDGRLGAA